MGLDDEDLDEEDLAILAEVKKKGYYHGRPKSQSCATPVRIEVAAPTPISGNEANKPSRVKFDEFQNKWDRFDREEFIDELVDRSPQGSELGCRVPLNGTWDLGGNASRTEASPMLEFKILLAGDPNVGKTAFVTRNLTGIYDGRFTPTLATRVHSLHLSTNCGDIVFHVVDLGSTTVKAAASRVADHCGDAPAHGALLMFDVSSLATYTSVPSWHQEIRRACGCVPTVLVGNKVDLKDHQVRPASVSFHWKSLAQYYDVSVRTGHNLAAPLLWLARRLVDQPDLVFVEPFARTPTVDLDPRQFALHDRELDEARKHSVKDHYENAI